MPDQPFETFFVLKPPQLPLIEKVLKFNIMILSNFFFSKHQNEKNSVIILLDSRTRRTLKSSVVVLGLVKLIDAKGIDVAQLIWL